MMQPRSLDVEHVKVCGQTGELAGPLMHCAAGVLGGSFSMALFYPLDFLRTNMHVCKEGNTHLLKSLSQVIQRAGFYGMYRGITAGILVHGLGWGIYLFLFRSAQQNLFSVLSYWEESSCSPGGIDGEQSIKKAFITRDFISACVASVFSGILLTPLNMIKTRQQLHDTTSHNKSLGLLLSLRQITHQEGYMSLLRGVGPQILLSGNITLHVTLYEMIKRKTFHSPEKPSWTDVAFASAMSKALASAICNPLEVMRTRLQDKRNRSQPEYRSMGAAFCTIWRTEGILGFYRGFPVSIARVMPTTVTAFVLYEKSLTTMLALNSIFHQYHNHGHFKGQQSCVDAGMID